MLWVPHTLCKHGSSMFLYTEQHKTKLKLSIFFLHRDDIANVFFGIKIA